MTNTPAPGPIKSGRPRAKSNQNNARFYETELYALLFKALPQHVKDGRLSATSLSVAIEMHKFTVYKWLSGNCISPKGAAAIIKESRGKLKVQDLAQFLIS
jgi:hypothetical protein